MAKSRHRAPKRSATRRPSGLRVVSEAPSAVQVGAPPGDDADEGEASALLTSVTGSLIEGVAQARSPLEAELVLCELFATVEQGAPEDADEDERATALSVLLDQAIGRAETLATPDALAMLRVCSVLGPASSRAAASMAVDRLVATGVAPAPWAGRVGRPTVLRAFRNGDVFGAQSTIGVLFDERGREHALMVLVDHHLGGGVKDCWVARGRAAKGIRDGLVAVMGDDPMTFLEDIDVASAAGLLASAVANPPCPEQDDQIEDVERYLYLVQSRARHLAELAGLPPVEVTGVPPAEVTGVPPADAADILRVKVTLHGIRPPIWRRLEVPATITLSRLHTVLQKAFGWTDTHLHDFEVDGEWGPRLLQGATLRRTRLGTVAGRVGDLISYRYDFGDDWIHEVEVEARHPADPGTPYPVCTAGRRATPPEDCGGAPGYAMLLEALADPRHPDHGEMSGWAPVGFDPAAFDRTAVNRALNALR